MADTDIRPAREEDHSRIRDIIEVSWRGQGGDWFFEQTFGPIGGRSWFEWLWPNLQRKLEQHPEWVFVTETNDQVVGVASLSLDRERQLGSIGYNAVDPTWRGHGIGRRQIDFVMEQFRREQMRYVGVFVALNEGHRAARGIYEKVGCRTAATFENRYASLPEDARSSLEGRAGATRPPCPADLPAVRTLVRCTLNGRHPQAVIEQRHGQLWGGSWVDGLMTEIGPRIESGSADVFVSERDGTCVGLAVSSPAPQRERGVVSHLLVDPEALETGADIDLVATAAKHFREQGLRFMQISTFAEEGRSGLTPALIQTFGLTDLVIRSEYKFQVLG